MTIKQFDNVRRWGSKRGIDAAAFQMQYQRVLSEVIEIHDAFNKNDHHEVKDAIGDTIVTLINLAKTVGENAEDCLDQAFDVIELRKGLNFNGDFIRYAKLSADDQSVCDRLQGNPGDQYFLRSDIDNLQPINFKK